MQDNQTPAALLGLRHEMQKFTRLTPALPSETQITQLSHPSAYMEDFLANASRNM